MHLNKFKKNLKKLSVLGLTALTLFSSLGKNISAEENKDNSINSREFLRPIIEKTPYYLSNGKTTYNMGFHLYVKSSMNGAYQTAFCLEPYKDIYSDVNYTPHYFKPGEVSNEIQYIAYLGYYLPESKQANPRAWLNSGEGQKAYINTQTMIWKRCGAANASNGTGNYAQFEADINNKLKNWNKRPSFNDQQINLLAGHKRTIKDENGILTDFIGYDKEIDLGNGVKIKGNPDNTVTITAAENSRGLVSFNSNEHGIMRHKPVGEQNILYKCNGQSQTMARMGNVDPVFYGFDINVVKKDSVAISKVDATTKKEIAGAKLSVSDMNGNVVDEWVSDGKQHLIENLIVGNQYVLKEVLPAPGYDFAQDITFTVDDNGEVLQHVVMEDERIEGYISLKKLDAETGDKAQGHATLNGAVFAVIDKTTNKEVGRILYNEGQPNSFKVPDVTHTYILKEIKAPKGYHMGVFVDGKLVPNNKEITFDWKKSQDNNAANNKLVSNNEFKDTVTKVEVSKVDITNKEELEGAHLELRDENNKVVDSWVSGKKPHMIIGLEANKEYTLIETQAPNGYEIAENIKFKVDENKMIQHVQMEDARKPKNVVQKVERFFGDVSTGDHTAMLGLFGLMLASGGVGIYLLVKNKKAKVNE